MRRNGIVKLKKILSGILAAALVMSESFPVMAAMPEKDALIEGIEESINELKEEEAADITVSPDAEPVPCKDYSYLPAGVYPDGLITPNSDEYTHYTNEEQIDGGSVKSADELPEYYCSEDQGYITPPRSQEDSNLCWSFAVSAALESSAIKNGHLGNREYISPDVPAYYFFNRVPDGLGHTEGVTVAAKSPFENNYYKNGGNALNMSLFLTQWMTPQLEEQAPFTGEPNTYLRTVEAAYGRDDFHVQNIRWASTDSTDSIKDLILTYGSVAANVSVGVVYEALNDEGETVYTVYNDTNVLYNHAVTLVGWDDSFDRENFRGCTDSSAIPERDGAWILKNSYLDFPYIYISYCDGSLVNPSVDNKVIAIEAELPDNHEHNYGYDGGVGSYTAASTDAIYGAEVFEACANGYEEGYEAIEAVSFAANTPGADYRIEIYTGDEELRSNPTNGTLQRTIESVQPLSYAGYYTIDLEAPVELEEGELFSVVVKLTAPKEGYQAAFMYDDSYVNSWVASSPNAKEGRSFLSKDGQVWIDTAIDRMPDFYDNSIKRVPRAGYVRIKAFTSDTVVMRTIEKEMVADVPDQVYTGNQLTPDPIIYYGQTRLIEGRDYTLSQGNNKLVGKKTGSVTINGAGIYQTRTPIVKTFSIKKRNLASPGVSVNGIDSVIYTGQSHSPIEVACDGITLRQGIDYTIRYAKNQSSGIAAATIVGKGCFTGRLKYNFNIQRRDINDEGIYIKPIKEQVYKDRLLTPEVVIINEYNNRNSLVENVDYTIEYRDNLMPGTGMAVITGKGNYSGTRIETFEIKAADIAAAAISSIPDQTYTGSAIAPAVTVTYGGKRLVESVDYDINYTNNINAGTAVVSISGRKGTMFAGTGITKTFNIRAAALDTAVIENFGDVTYSTGVRYYTQNEKPGSGQLKLRLPSGFYIDPEDYTISYTNNYSTGSNVRATMTVKAAGNNVTGSISKSFEIINGTKILLNDFTDSKLLVTGFSASRQYIYDASNHKSNADNSVKPSIRVSYKGAALTPGKDYTVTYSNNNGIGMASLTIEAVSGSGYSGSRTEYFEIIGKPIYVTALGVADNDFYAYGPDDCTYTGTPRTPEIKIYEKIIKDKTENNKDGQGVKRLQEGEDYTLKYNKNVDAGTATVTLKGIGAYSGEHVFTFKINSADISQLSHSPIPSQYYTGRQIKPELALRNAGRYLMEGVDYNRSFGENINAGTGTVIYTAAELTQKELDAGMLPNYVGQLTVDFSIKPMKLSASSIRVSALDATPYEGGQQTLDARLVMSVDGEDVIIPEADYNIIYGRNDKVGKGKAVFKARTRNNGATGNFYGSRTHVFNIYGASFTLSENALTGYEVPYTGKKSKFSIPIIGSGDNEYIENEDYIIKTDGRSQYGEGVFTMQGIGRYKGSMAYGTYEIVPVEAQKGEIEISKVKNVSLDKSTVPVKQRRFSVKYNRRKLKQGKDYVVTYFNNDSKGTATMVVTLVGNYSGSESAVFKIE